ncbi:MAG: 2-hydroxyacyl-CoA dehydratase [Deltaproteobacteria bacterium]|nr:2-hydroxyacyl-CoA dehydratase [Deltaproteobacteria bacterium]
MKRETMEYNYDWNLWTILECASKTNEGFCKEYHNLLKYVPHYGPVLEAFMRFGQPGDIFLKLMAGYMKMCVTSKENGKFTALTSFCMAPPILYAFDIVPMCLEVWTVLGTIVLRRGTTEFLDYCCEVGFTETSCSAQRGALGAYLAGLCTQPDFIVFDSPGICDTNANSFAFASAFLDKPMFQLNSPPTLSDERATKYHRRDFRNLITFLEKQTGKKLDFARLKEIVGEIKRQDEIACELFDLASLVPSPLPGMYDLMLYGGKFMMGGTREYTLLLESMLQTAKGIADKNLSGTLSGREKARALFCYIDHYTTNARFWYWIDEHDISMLGSMLFTFWQKDVVYAKEKQDQTYDIDDSSDEAIIDSLADQVSRMPMVKQIRGPYDAPGMMLDDTLGAARVLNVDFIVYVGTMGCRNTWGVIKCIARDLEKAGYPTLVLYADGFDDRVQSWESITDKLNEFISLRRIGA